MIKIDRTGLRRCVVELLTSLTITFVVTMFLAVVLWIGSLSMIYGQAAGILFILSILGTVILLLLTKID